MRWEVLDYQKQAANRLNEPLHMQAEPYSQADVTDDNPLAQAIAALAEPERLVVQLFYLHELAQQQIALILDIPPGTVKSRLHRARAQLQQALKEGD